MNKRIILKESSDTKKLEGFAQIVNGKLWAYFQGHTYAVETTKKSHRKRTSEGKSSPHQILAPMPGKITKLLVAEGQAVEVGQAIVVMEAMKMEYTLKSELPSTIDKINVIVGDQVQLGQLLVKLTES